MHLLLTVSRVRRDQAATPANNMLLTAGAVVVINSKLRVCVCAARSGVSYVKHLSARAISNANLNF